MSVLDRIIEVLSIGWCGGLSWDKSPDRFIPKNSSYMLCCEFYVYGVYPWLIVLLICLLVLLNGAQFIHLTS